ncbi:TolC family protein [Bacteroidota bacterium]
MKNSILMFSVLLIFFSSVLYGQNKTFTIEEAIYTALENNRDIKIALMEIEKADAAVDEAFGYALPSLDLSANFAHFIEKPKMAFPDFMAMLTNATYETLFDEGLLPRDEDKFLPMKTVLQSFAQSNSFEASARITQILFNSAVFRGIGASQIYLNLSNEQLKGTVANTILTVKQAFYGVLLTHNLLEIFEASLANAEENLRLVQSMFKQGLVSEYEAMQVEVQVENIKPQVMELRNKLQSAKDGLKIVLGLDQFEEISVEGEFVYRPELLPAAGILIEDAMESNYDINTLQTKRQIDEEFIAIDRSDYWPTIAAFGSYNYAGSSDDLNFQTYNSTMVGLSLTMNLFQGLRTSKKVEQSTISVMQTDEQLKQLKDFISSEVRGKVLQLKKVEAQVAAVTRNVELAQKTFEISMTRYKEGTGTLLEIKNADIELRTAKTNKLQSVYEFIIAKAELDKLLGNLDENYLRFVQNKIEN